VLCLYAEKDRDVANALDVSKWEFYVLSTTRINRELGAQKRVVLSRIRAMTEPVGYGLIKEHVDQVLSGADSPHAYSPTLRKPRGVPL
jgi:hypothetical protein